MDLASIAWQYQWTCAFPTLVTEFFQEQARPWLDLAYRTLHYSPNHYRKHTNNPPNQQAFGSHTWADCLGYGEITPQAVWKILDCIHHPQDDYFVVDVGSGTGNVLLAASLALPIRTHFFGIELVPEWHHQARQNQKQWNEQGLILPDIQFICGDCTIHTECWTRATLLLCHATAFSQKLVDTVENLIATQCQPGTFVCMISRQLPRLEKIHTLMLDMSWGQATVYIQRVYSRHS